MVQVKSNFARNRLLIQGKDGLGVNAYWLVAVDALKIPILKKKMAEGHVNLKQFGEVIESGYGDAPEGMI